MSNNLPDSMTENDIPEPPPDPTERMSKEQILDLSEFEDVIEWFDKWHGDEAVRDWFADADWSKWPETLKRMYFEWFKANKAEKRAAELLEA